MKYRKEIDGLRGLSIFLVIIFHLKIFAFKGGFLGVDIFFVISGYLITNIIISELEMNKFSLIGFYERRIRRIIPALYFVIIISSFFAYYWMIPESFENYGQSVVATSLFSNNILLLFTSSYWSLNSDFKPLLHTWSLGVEEQFYLLYPILLIFFYKFFKKLLYLNILIIFVSSVIFNFLAYKFSENASFYLLPSRAWELLAGSLVAMQIKKKNYKVYNHYLQQYLSSLGIMLILIPVFFFDFIKSHLPIVGILPVIGTMLIIIYANEETLINKFLRSSLLVKLGLISYSAYLWHWPIFSFARIYSVNQPSLFLMFFLTILTIFISFISYIFIEKPFRIKNRFTFKKVCLGLFVVSVLLISFGFYTHITMGMTSRFEPHVSKKSYKDISHISYNEKVYHLKKNNFSNDVRLKILIVGNSYARDFVNVIQENFDNENIDIIYRNDFNECLLSLENDIFKDLYNKSNIIIFASGGYKKQCINENIELVNLDNKEIFYVGYKHFGYNLNWLTRIPKTERINKSNIIINEAIIKEKKLIMLIPKENFIPLLSKISKNNKVMITDESGNLLSIDLKHLTKAGARFVGKKAVNGTNLSRIILKGSIN
jgi:peptidoglycan/LPS O-acetylase OafA/YrhL